jgi:ParB family transcriptional regulator, chromosome partitioning protein
MSKKVESAVEHSSSVKKVRVAELFPNPHNPRVLFDREPMEILEDSIRKVGILVPLTVYWESARKRYVILDGQRRWICAQKVGLEKVPINEVAEPTLVQNIVTMFQIHKLRADWELMPTALKVQLLMEEVKDTNNARLAELTGLDEAVIVRCKKLISFDREFQDLMLDPDPAKRIKADFFIELYAVLHDKDVSKFAWFKANEFTRQMLEKYLVKPRTIKSVTDFRTIKQHITNARRIGAISTFSKRLRFFAENLDAELKSLEIQEAQTHAEAKALTKRVSDLDAQVRALDVEDFYGEEELWISLSRLLEAIDAKLRKADKKR